MNISYKNTPPPSYLGFGVHVKLWGSLQHLEQAGVSLSFKTGITVEYLHGFSLTLLDIHIVFLKVKSLNPKENIVFLNHGAVPCSRFPVDLADLKQQELPLPKVQWAQLGNDTLFPLRDRRTG